MSEHNDTTDSRGEQQCVKCGSIATHRRVLKDGAKPNPQSITLCEDHADEGDERL